MYQQGEIVANVKVSDRSRLLAQVSAVAKSIYTCLPDPASISQQPVLSLNLIIRPAGVAQSVERVALIFSDIPNLKVEGSSPSFGYSYKQTAGDFFLHYLELLEKAFRMVVEKLEFFFLVCEAWLGGQGWRWT
jgi:hypothetical protein